MQDIKPPERKKMVMELTPDEFFNKIKESSKDALDTFEAYQKMSRQPKGHFCDRCDEWYANYNKEEEAKFLPTPVKPKYERIFPKCSRSLENPEIPKREWIDMGGSEAEYELIRINSDPVKWAAAELGFVTEGYDYSRKGEKVSQDRWYQKEMLRCSSELKVYRAGRRIGKCLEEGTEVMTTLGPVEIEKLIPGDIVYGYDPDTDTTFETPVLNVFDQGVKDVVDLTRRDKPIVGTTLEHRFHTVTERGYKKVREVNDLYKSCSITRKFVKAPMGSIYEPQAYALGALLGDGCSKQKGSAIQISSGDEEVVKAVKDSIGGKYYWKSNSNNFTWVISNYEQGYCSSSTSNKQIESPLYDEWIKGRYAHQKTVDIETLKSWDRNSCLAFLAGLLDTDGSVQVVNGKELSISIDSQSDGIIEAVVFLMKALFQKTPSVVLDKRPKYVNGQVRSVRIKNNLHCSRILRELATFIKCERKSWKSEYSKLLHNNENENFLGVQVDKSKTRKARCWDIEIGTKDHLFLLGNGMVSHNSETMCIEVLFNLDRYEDFCVILIAPFETQLLKFEEKLMHWLEQSVSMKDKLLKYNKTKHTITFSNGSKYEGYCTGGDKQSKTADRVRGAGASLLVLDEADYISEDALQAVLAVKSDDPDCKILLSSTPSGKRGFFHSWCVNKYIGFKEHYVISHASPSYTKDADKLYRDTLSVDKYKKEYLGDFGTMIEALLDPRDINKCTEAYDMSRLRQSGARANCRYIVGVDWNGRKIGTVIVVIEFDSAMMKYKMVDKIVIKDTEHNYENSCWAVIKAFQHWGAEYIYADAGHGDMQCACPHTNVYTSQGYKEIKDIIVGDLVLTHNRRFKKVLATSINTCLKKMISIKPVKSTEINTSEDHPHMVHPIGKAFKSDMKLDVSLLKQKKAVDIDPKTDLLCFVRQHPNNTSYVTDLTLLSSSIKYDDNFVWNEHSYSSSSDISDSVILSQIRTSRATLQRIRSSFRKNSVLSSSQQKVYKQIMNCFPEYVIPTPIKVNRYVDTTGPEFLRLLGWYLSEGSSHNGCVEFPQNVVNKNDPFIVQMTKDIETCFGISPSIYYRTEPRLLARVVINNTVIASLFEKFGGKGHEDKNIHPELMLRWNKLGQCLRTIILGDGSITKAGSIRIGLCSKNLIAQLKQIFINYGTLPSEFIRTYNNPKWKDLYILDLPSEEYTIKLVKNITGLDYASNLSKYRIARRWYAVSSDFIAVRVRALNSLPPKRGLIDIQVEDDNTFIANGIITHNCEMIKKTAKQIGDSKLARNYVAIYMDGSQEIRDPYTGEVVKKKNKEFAINLMVNAFEQGRVIIPYSENYKEDDEDWGVIPQLYDLAIEGFGSTGRPKWATSVDHTLAGLYLAILGFHMKMSDLGTGNFNKEVYIESHGDLKKLPGNITIHGGDKRKNDKSFDSIDKIKPGSYIPRSLGNGDITGPSFGGMPTTNAKYIKYDKNGITTIKHDNTVGHVRLHNLGIISRKTF